MWADPAHSAQSVVVLIAVTSLSSVSSGGPPAGTQCVCNPNRGNTCGSGTQCNMSTCTCEVIVGLTPGG